MRDFGLSKWALNPMTCVFIRERQKRLEIHRGKDDVKMEARDLSDTAISQGSLGSPEAARGKKEFYSKPLEGVWPY